MAGHPHTGTIAKGQTITPTIDKQMNGGEEQKIRNETDYNYAEKLKQRTEMPFVSLSLYIYLFWIL